MVRRNSDESNLDGEVMITTKDGLASTGLLVKGNVVIKPLPKGGEQVVGYSDGDGPFSVTPRGYRRPLGTVAAFY